MCSPSRKSMPPSRTLCLTQPPARHSACTHPAIFGGTLRSWWNRGTWKGSNIYHPPLRPLLRQWHQQLHHPTCTSHHTEIIRLASNEANFTCRVSATLLMCNVYPRAGPNKEKIRKYHLTYSASFQTYPMRKCFYCKEWQPPKYLKCAGLIKKSMCSPISLVSSSTALQTSKIKSGC